MKTGFMVFAFGDDIIREERNGATSPPHPTVSDCFRTYRDVTASAGAMLRRYTASMNRPIPSRSADVPRILVVDDDPALRELLADYLATNGFAVATAPDGAAMRAALSEGMPDALVLDLMLPGEDGLALTRFIRAQSNVPILMLSARGEEMDRVIGLEVGADDYLAKPFGPRELLARLRALLRRGQPALPVAEIGRPAARFGPFALDADGRRLLRDGVEVSLTGAEYDLLAAFVARPNRVLSRDVLVDLLKGYERDPFDRSIDIRVARLRRKIEADPVAPVYIRTVRGEGYLFNPRGHTAV
jgi:two-component system phosphate regulon response regulator OmpR